MTSYETFQGLSLVVQLIPAVIALAAWGLRPLLHAFRILFLQKNDNSWAKSKEHQVMKSYIRPLLLWGGVVLICRVLKPVILHSSTKPSCQATASEFCSFIVYSFGICILLIEGGLPTLAALSVVTQTTRKLLIEQAGECLTQLTRQLEDQENVTDLVARLRMQSNALRSGALLQNLDKVKESQEQFDFF
nr:mechanosensitive ion channel protein 2, chloroplastic-like isoform X1 [Tanacetum cinerariifolium]